MVRPILFITVCGFAASLYAEEPTMQLPKPHYQRQASDPQWLADAVQFHGHLGPAAIAGVRVGMAGLRAVDAKGFFDIDVTCEGPMVEPPQSCFLDGLQVATGATMGKRSIHWVKADAIVVRFKNTKSGKTAVVRPTSQLLELVPAFTSRPSPEMDHDQSPGKPMAEGHMESLARRIAAMPENALAVVATEDKTQLWPDQKMESPPLAVHGGSW